LEMDAYMRENKLEGQRSEIVAPAAAPVASAPVEEFIDDPKTKTKPKGKAATH